MEFLILLKYCKKGEQKYPNFMPGQALIKKNPNSQLRKPVSNQFVLLVFISAIRKLHYLKNKKWKEERRKFH
jgi:hypothetical protein